MRKLLLLLILSPFAFGAIAFDAASSTSASNSGSLSWTHSCSGAERLLVIEATARNGNTTTTLVSSITFNGVALTRAKQQQETGDGNTAEIWYLVAPPTGANTVVVTYAGTNVSIAAGAISLTGVDQTSPLDAVAGTTFAGGSVSQAITTVANNAWTIDCLALGGSITISSSGSGQVMRWGGTSSSGAASTKGPITPAGANTQSHTWGSFAQGAYAIASFKPSTGAASTCPMTRSTLGVGC